MQIGLACRQIQSLACYWHSIASQKIFWIVSIGYIAFEVKKSTTRKRTIKRDIFVLKPLAEWRLMFGFLENLLTVFAYKVGSTSGKEQSPIITVDGFQDGRWSESKFKNQFTSQPTRSAVPQGLTFHLQKGYFQQGTEWVFHANDNQI